MPGVERKPVIPECDFVEREYLINSLAAVLGKELKHLYQVRRRTVVGGQIPDPAIPSSAACDDALAVGDKLRRGGGLQVAQRRDDRLARFGVPDAGGIIAAGGQQPAAVGTEAGKPNLVPMADLSGESFACFGVPDAGGAIFTGCGYAATIGAERSPIDAVKMKQRLAQGSARRHVPHLGRESRVVKVCARGHEAPAIRAEFGLLDFRFVWQGQEVLTAVHVPHEHAFPGDPPNPAAVRTEEELIERVRGDQGHTHGLAIGGMPDPRLMASGGSEAGPVPAQLLARAAARSVDTASKDRGQSLSGSDVPELRSSRGLTADRRI